MNEAIDLRDRILRGDIVVGILGVEAFDEMIELFQAAGEAGDPRAWFELGQALASGLNTLEPDPWRAVEALEKAWDAGAGRDAGLAFVKTAYFNRHDGVDPEKIRSAANALCSQDEDGTAHLLAGWLHYAGYGFEQDQSRAVELHTAAAALGNADAMFELSVLYGTGQGVEADEQAAHDWCKKAAEAGSARAMYNLGSAFATGRVVEPDDAAAIDWYDKAARHGHGRAAATLSVMFATGQGAPEDVDRAEEYFELSWDNGFDPFILYDAMGVDPPFEV